MLLGFAASPSSTESAIANGDTRTVSFSNSHTNESGSFTYMVNGYYDSATLEKLNWFMRDWRLNESTKMDPKLFDIIWEVYRQSGSTQPIDVLSGYRSPQTNAMLRRRSRQVAEHSQHMEGKAIDAHFIDVGPGPIRDIAMRMQSGGVGFYPIGSTPWVHIDSGSVRYWPRMSRDAISRLFPDGKTVFIPSDGQPMPGYEQARAEIEARGGEIQIANNGGSGFGLLGWLFGGPRGGGADDAEEGGESGAASSRNGRSAVPDVRVASAAPTPEVLSRAKRDLPRGDTFLQAAPTPTPTPQPTQVVASLDPNVATDESPVALHGPIAARFIAPLPPRKPADLALAMAALNAPVPIPRPTEFAAAPSKTASVSGPPNTDLIAALLERGKLPGVITRGVGGTPSSALALADTGAIPEPPERPNLLARAAALSAPLPPLPPVRLAGRTAAKPDPLPLKEISTAPRRTAPTPQPQAAIEHRSTQFAANDAAPSPYGGLVLDAFEAPAGSSGGLASGLRGPAP